MVRVFCDFDGTVCQQDVGELFFRKFAGEFAEKSVARLLKNEITMQNWLLEMCENIPLINHKEFFDFVDQFNIDSYFPDFLNFCKARNVSLTILSDGLDLYVERILTNAGLQDVSFFANHIEIENKGKLRASFLHTDSECTLCGNCKRNHMLRLSADEDIIVYVGDGYSDRCPIQFADIVFAKRHLIKYCQAKNITYFSFNHFGDIKVKMDEILQRKRIRHRQEAAMMRREVFMQG